MENLTPGHADKQFLAITIPDTDCVSVGVGVGVGVGVTASTLFWTFLLWSANPVTELSLPNVY
jgi:hypothetical protein